MPAHPDHRIVAARRLAAFIVAFLVATMTAGAMPAAAQQAVRLATTTSTENSGLLAYLLPRFEADTGIKVKVIAVGTGKALELAKNGDVDAALVHARESEDRFMADGHGADRRDVMHNDFLLVGPAGDPAGIKGGKDILAALKKIANGKARFISRGDHSGTDQMEKSYWKQISAMPSGRAYISAGLGMGEVLTMAAELQAYTLTDRATYSTYRAKTGLEVMVEGDPKMFNQYGIIAVHPDKHRHVNYQGAMQLINWLGSDKGRQTIAGFKVQGQQLFYPHAKTGQQAIEAQRPDHQ